MLAYVAASKGVLLSDPSFKNLSTGQLMFEYSAIRRKERSTYELVAKSFRTLLVSILGLNAIKPADETGMPKQYEDMTEDERESFLPLVAWVGRPELLKIVKEQIDAQMNIKKATEDEEYEKLVAAIDAADGDMEPILGLQVNTTKAPTETINSSDAKASENEPSTFSIDVGDV